MNTHSKGQIELVPLHRGKTRQFQLYERCKKSNPFCARSNIMFSSEMSRKIHKFVDMQRKMQQLRKKSTQLLQELDQIQNVNQGTVHACVCISHSVAVSPFKAGIIEGPPHEAYRCDWNGRTWRWKCTPAHDVSISSNRSA